MSKKKADGDKAELMSAERQAWRDGFDAGDSLGGIVDRLKQVHEQLDAPDQNAIKAEDWQREPSELPWQAVHCRECNVLMHTRLPGKHDLCEMCGYNLRQQMQDIEQQQIRQRGDRLLNPFDGGMFANTTSIPSQEK